MICDLIMRSAHPFMQCVPTPSGARVETSCIYPSFDPVSVYVVGNGEGFVVHDGGGAAHSAMQHGRNPNTLLSALREQAVRYGLEVIDGHLRADCPSADWLPSAIMSVANGAATAAAYALDHASDADEAEDDLRREMADQLYSRFPKERIHSRVSRTGRSGKRFSFDFAVNRESKIILVSPVTRSSISVAVRYTAFEQVGARALGGAIAAYRRRLKDEDAIMLQEVADLVPATMLADSVERELYAHAT